MKHRSDYIEKYTSLARLYERMSNTTKDQRLHWYYHGMSITFKQVADDLIADSKQAKAAIDKARGV